MPHAIRLALVAALTLSASSCQRIPLLGAAGEPEAAAPAAEPAHSPRLLTGLGSHRHPISTKVNRAQRYFDQGLILTFGFNHEGAIDAFREAARLDPDCAMCWWGVAYAYGPNINAPMGPEAATKAYAALQEARARLGSASLVEREYIEALTARYAPDPQPADRSSLDAAYADAMRALHERHPDDVDAATLYAEAVMDLHPWDYWLDDGAPRPGTLEAGRALERVLERDPWHPGANHFLIHAYEEFQPERAEAAADRLVSVAPEVGHLVHMPAHIYWRVGRYQDAWRVNELAAAADVAYFTWCRSLPFYASLYYNHNVHFLWAASAAEGRSDEALTAARRLVSGVPMEQVAEVPPLEDFLTIPVLTLVRFGRFDAALAEPRPPQSLRYATAFSRYARGLALVRLGRLDEAEAERAAVAAAAAELAQVAWFGTPIAPRIEIAAHHLAGELAAARGRTGEAVAELEAAVRKQDALPYTEPPPFYFPTRQALGAVLLAAGRAVEAEAVHREDLRRHPKNGWSLFGLAESLRAQRKRAEAAWAEKGYRSAWARADVKLAASRF